MGLGGWGIHPKSYVPMMCGNCYSTCGNKNRARIPKHPRTNNPAEDGLRQEHDAFKFWDLFQQACLKRTPL